MLDSEADFKARCREVGFADGDLTRFDALGYNTFAKLAFASNYVPGQVDEGPLKNLAIEISGVDPPPTAKMPLIRRLVYESYTLAASDLKMRTERKDDDAPRRLAQGERSARYQEQKTRLTGVDMTGELEPSHHLIDLVYNMAEDNQLRYIKWEECTKRDQELMGVKTDPIWKADASGVIKEVKVKETLRAEFDTDLKLKFLLQRRSLAFDQSKLLDYELFEKWTRVLLEAYSSPPPEGFLKVSLEQVHRADMELFKTMMRESRGGIKPNGAGQPLKDVFTEAMKATEVRMHLQPLQGTKRKSDQSLDSSSTKDEELRKLQRQVMNLEGRLKNKGFSKGKSQASTSASPRASSRSSSKSKGKGKRWLVKLPPALIGMSPTTADNEPICYNFNLAGCDGAAPGERCDRGWHVCMMPGCGKPHSVKNHKNGGA